jgi:hypothetical protein
VEEAATAFERENLASIHSGLQKVFEVSSFLNFPFTVDEVASYFLPGLNLTGPQLRSLFAKGSFGDIPFEIENSYLLTHTAQSVPLRSERQQFSTAKLHSATEFARTLTKLIPFFHMIAVTGSVAYRSAEKWDDIDLFIVTKRNRLWLTLLMSIILVRVWKVLRLRPSHLMPFCLSYVHDDRGFEEDSVKNRANPLFARELLMAEPVVGVNQYRELLVKNDWVEGFYSNPYRSKMKQLAHYVEIRESVQSEHFSPFELALDLAEGVTFALLSRYLRMRAYLTNLRLRSQRMDFRVFEPRISKSSCVYTSNFYRWLHAIWGQK